VIARLRAGLAEQGIA